ncbi:hypothetical protein NO2_0775 [Candidatus Termititenax persephonae]|uniref:Uncharacterized protein n=1 Tax=Candidatus Termititenax persephonae TaxID=2218525 RepID=A0A388TH76_9BACT|nr:hypothetical protein NO2_0775 [Candidatus Termititenax persephonae]
MQILRRLYGEADCANSVNLMLVAEMFQRVNIGKNYRGGEKENQQCGGTPQ